MYFTEAEFDTMVKELSKDPQEYDMLSHIADKTLSKLVVYWCNSLGFAKRGFEEDIMQQIQLRLMQVVTTKFLYPDGPDKPCNRDTEYFYRWLKKIAYNITRTFLQKERGIEGKTIPIEDVTIDGWYTDESDDEERTEKLEKAFSIVLASDVKVYKILTWLAYYIIYDSVEAKTSDMIEKVFSEHTLNTMYEKLKELSGNFPWIIITDEQDDKIRAVLDKKRKNSNVSFGETKYKEFFMKCKGETNGKKSISDWVYRMDEFVKKEF